MPFAENGDDARLDHESRERKKTRRERLGHARDGGRLTRYVGWLLWLLLLFLPSAAGAAAAAAPAVAVLGAISREVRM
jgi:hypothetical protein